MTAEHPVTPDQRRPREVDARGNCSKCGGTHYSTGWYCPMPLPQEIDDVSTTENAAEMPRYKCHKEVWALKIAQVRPIEGGGATITPEDTRYAPFTVDSDYVGKHYPHEGGYFVQYQDGYKSFSPAKSFEEGYTRV